MSRCTMIGPTRKSPAQRAKSLSLQSEMYRVQRPPKMQTWTLPDDNQQGEAQGGANGSIKYQLASSNIAACGTIMSGADWPEKTYEYDTRVSHRVCKNFPSLAITYIQWGHINAMASQTNGNSTVFRCIVRDNNKENIKSPHHGPFVRTGTRIYWARWESIRHRGIPLAKPKKFGIRFHVMMSPWSCRVNLDP